MRVGTDAVSCVSHGVVVAVKLHFVDEVSNTDLFMFRYRAARLLDIKPRNIMYRNSNL